MTRVVVRMESGGTISFPVNRSLPRFLSDLAVRVEGPVEMSVEVSDR